jgi:hypothetical protein
MITPYDLNNKLRILLILLSIGCSMPKVVAQRSTADSLNSMSYIQNEFIKVGIDLNLGGSITFLADAKKGENMINNYDWGRQIQMSFYSGPNPYAPNGKEPLPFWRNLGWNPIQSGDYAGNRSKVLEYKNDGKQLYVKCIPMHWPLDNEPAECTFESWIVLKGNTVQVRSRVVNNREDKTQYKGSRQELPAVYTNAPYHRMISYRGDKPFTKDTVSHIKNHNYPKDKEIKWAYWHATEGWAANVNDDNYGLGIWNPEIQEFCGGFYGDDKFTGGSKKKETGYIAPRVRDIFDHNITYDYNYVLILGTLDEIRNYVYKNAKKQKLPQYVFTKDRQHWSLENTTDAGWPIENKLVIKLRQNATLVSPMMLWNSADAGLLTFTAKYPIGTPQKGKVYLNRFNQPNFDEQLSFEFDAIADGKPHEYRIPLKKSANYNGAFSKIKIVLSTTDAANQTVEVKSIALKK